MQTKETIFFGMQYKGNRQHKIRCHASPNDSIAESNTFPFFAQILQSGLKDGIMKNNIIDFTKGGKAYGEKK